MAGLQTIINKAGTIDVNRRKVVGVQITRNEIPRTSLTPTRQPWQFTIEMPNSLRYYDNRNLVESLDYIDRYTPQQVSFGNSCLSWMFAYQGSFTAGEIAGISVSSFNGTTLRLTGVPIKTGSFVCFKQNDLIQIGANPYPFTVVGPYQSGSTTLGDVTYSTNTGGDLYITMHRPNFLNSVALSGITVGPSCTFNLFCPNMPTYKLIPGGYMESSGTTINNALIEFSDSFTMYEWVGGAA